MIIIDSLIVGGIRFVLDKVATAVDREMSDDDFLRQELLSAQMRYELGEIGDQEFTEIEADLLTRLRESRRRRDEEHDEEGGGLSLGGGRRVVGAEVSFAGDAEDEDA